MLCSLKRLRQPKTLSNAKQWTIGVVGASGELGRRIVDQLLAEQNVKIIATSRNPDQLESFRDFDSVNCVELDLEHPEKAAKTLRHCEVIVFCPILSLSVYTATALRELGSEARLILISSNNAGLDEVSPVYAELRDCEDQVRSLATPWSLIRPTMIYGSLEDGNLGRLIQLAVKSPILPILGSGQAIQSPIHYDDLTSFIVDILFDLDWEKEEVCASGAETKSLRDIYEEIYKLLQKKGLVVSLPVGFLSPILRLLERFKVRLPITSAQLARAEIDRLPTWPVRDGWSADIPLHEGLTDIIDQLDTKQSR